MKPHAQELLVEATDLRKSYGSVEVLHGIQFRLGPGELVGFLGSNGAGKTTTLRILLGLLAASSGSARLFGQESRPSRGHNRRAVGYLPGDVNFYPWLNGEAILRYLAAARGLDCHSEYSRLAEVFQLDLQKPTRKYSTGMKQKLGLIQALMHRPRLLILDEPTNGLDPLIRQVLMAELRTFVARGGSVLFSSHTLSEVEELCDRVIILRAGSIVADQTIRELRPLAGRRVEVALQSAAKVAANLPEAARMIQLSGQQLTMTWSGPASELIAWLATLDCEEVSIGVPSLDDLFLAYYRQEA